MKKKNIKFVWIGLLILGVILLISAFIPTSSVKFRTSDLSYSHIFESAESSIAYSSIKGGELAKYGLSTYGAYDCDSMTGLTYLFNIPGTLDGTSVKLYSYGTDKLFVCSDSSAVVYSNKIGGTVETDSKSIDSTREVLW